ncbi:MULTISPECIES: DUF1127 domain-containing protein [Halomonadaceae]|uniref:DUF1127 domain-containing protein n=2 Tax=Halomonadaceae TaxID=28256 RepID=A0AAP9ZF85_9GAMM|nr:MULTISPECIES: DUF1127 domain-containing protein [Halomonas]AZM97369.1 DUF1127 domain-containing protein [Halomonas venusta]MDX1354981.1 DUF1127 domain-containing protein [Halomonas venusta]MDX1714123.1 DUF1127 domain-containing protein [Halomonas venusta]NPT31400.1 hypothetical protein [Halomonas venusta]QPI63655.1 DUF1127 domain-containing protein [Halomonas venusta]
MLRFSLTQIRCQLRHYYQRRCSRRQLLALDDRLLKDIGITRTQAQKEGCKPFWKHSSCKRGPYENC